MEHASEGLSLGAVMKLMVIKQNLQVTNFGGGANQEPCDYQYRVGQLARSGRGHLMSRN